MATAVTNKEVITSFLQLLSSEGSLEVTGKPALLDGDKPTVDFAGQRFLTLPGASTQ